MKSRESPKLSGNDFEAFQVIQDFIINLYDYFKDKNSFRSLKMYYKIINNTNFNENDIIMRHIQAFKRFCMDNRDEIRNKNNLKHPKISFSDKIFIDVNHILYSIGDDIQTRDAVWEYIFSISAFLDPENKTKELLQNLKNSNGNEGNFITGIMETLQSQMGENGGLSQLINPSVISNVSAIMNSSMENGNLDLGKLMSTVTSMMSSINPDDPVLQNVISVVQLPSVVTQPEVLDAPEISEEIGE